MTNDDNRSWQEQKSAAVAFANWRTRHDRFNRALDDIQRTHAMSGVEGVGMLLMGIPGLGKSSILDSYVRHHLSGRDDLESPGRSREPIIRLSVPAEPTLKTLIQAILLASSYEGSIKGTVGELKQKLDEFIRERGVELLIFDEFQHFLREQAKSNTRGVVNHIKLVMDQHKLAVVMAGTPEGYRSIAHYEELYQRFAQRQTRLAPFRIDSEENLQAFGSYLRACTSFLKRHGFEFVPLANKEMMLRIYVATQGIPRLIYGLLKVGIEDAEHGRPITQKNLAEGFSRTSMNPDLKTFNPFRAPYNKVLERAREVQKKAASEDRKSWDIH